MLLKTLRCEISLGYIAAVVLLAMLLSHPLYLSALFLSLMLVILSAGIMRVWGSYLKFCALLILTILLINTLFVQAGATILWQGPAVPVIGVIRITLEAFCYGAVMGLRLLIIMAAFCLLNWAVNPDQVLKTFGGGKGKILLALSISLRLFPLVAEEFSRIKAAQRCRGVNFEIRGVRQRVKRYIPVLNTVLMSSLERSFQLAEALQIKGYGTAQRTSCREQLWRPRDTLILATLLMGLVYVTAVMLRGGAIYQYYPRLQPLYRADVLKAVFLSLLFMFPALVD